MQPNHHAAISNDFSIKIKNNSCSPNQKQLMQPNCHSCIKTAHTITRKKQLMQPNHHAAIFNDFSIKNSS
jgi:hypothetical protein